MAKAPRREAVRKGLCQPSEPQTKRYTSFNNLTLGDLHSNTLLIDPIFGGGVNDGAEKLKSDSTKNNNA